MTKSQILKGFAQVLNLFRFSHNLAGNNCYQDGTQNQPGRCLIRDFNF